MAEFARLLVIEDDDALRDSLSDALRSVGFTVLAMPDGLALADVLRNFRPDAALLDIGLTRGPDGFALAEQIRAHASISVIFLTAADALDDRLRGFALGADDYVVKPFAFAEVLARVRAVLKRSGGLASQVIELRDLIFDEQNHIVVRGDVELELTQTEFELLAVFAREPNRVFSKPQLLSLVWDFAEYDPNLVEVHVSALRRKMEACGPRLIHTVRGVGYELRV
jgi:DNA-binding response OmpR family regulator